jgi:hypothetical protein
MAITIRKIACPEPPVGADLMKTGQTTSYRTGDDGDIEAGRDVDFFTLASNNPFGNTNRFTDELGGSTYTNNIVIDWSTYDNVAGTVLGVYRIASIGNVTWEIAIDDSLSLSVGTFTSGWRLWNINEMNNFTDWALNYSNVFGYSPLNLPLGSYWTSTSVSATNAIRQAYSGTVSLGLLSKGAGQKRVSVRTFTVNGTTLT